MSRAILPVCAAARSNGCSTVCCLKRYLGNPALEGWPQVSTIAWWGERPPWQSEWQQGWKAYARSLANALYDQIYHHIGMHNRLMPFIFNLKYDSCSNLNWNKFCIERYVYITRVKIFFILKYIKYIYSK